MVINMDRDKILEKSRKENENRDEMERTITIEGESFSLAFTLMAGLAIVAYNHFHNLSSDSVMIMSGPPASAAGCTGSPSGKMPPIWSP